MSESTKGWVCHGTLLTDEQAKALANGDPLWHTLRAEFDRQGAEAKRVMDEAVALTSWSTRAQAATDAFSPRDDG